MTAAPAARASRGFLGRLPRVLGLAALSIALAVASSRQARAADSLSVATAPDYSGYQTLLDDYLTVTSEPGAAIETRFNYTRFFRDPELAKRTATIRRQMFGFAPSRLAPRARQAWAINAYNYLVLETVTNNLFEGTQRANKDGKRVYFALRIASVQTIALDQGSFFEAPVIEVEGAKYSLNDFERHFLFADFDPTGNKKPPSGLDPRAHFAVACAAKGGPALLPRAYSADSLDQQLDYATRNALKSPNHLRFVEPVGRLEASSIFDWHREDFGGVEGAFAFVKKYAPSDTRATIEKRKVPWIATYILWDWSLNHVDGEPTQDDKGSG
jgi:hypothetical protein